MSKPPLDVRCDVCESPNGRPVWIFRVHEFQVGYEGQGGWQHYPEGDQWGVCALCKADILADDQDSILDRRRASASMLLGGVMNRVEFAEYTRLLDVLLLAFLASRDKSWPGRSFTIKDYTAADHDIQQAGHRL